MIKEVDYNHPDYPDKRLQRALEEIKLATAIEVESGGALVIYLPNEHKYPPQIWKIHLKDTEEIFPEISPLYPLNVFSISARIYNSERQLTHTIAQGKLRRRY